MLCKALTASSERAAERRLWKSAITIIDGGYLAASLQTGFIDTHAFRNLELHDTGIERHVALGLAFRDVGGAAGHGIRGADAHGKQKETQFFQHRYSLVGFSDDDGHPWRAVPYTPSGIRFSSMPLPARPH